VSERALITRALSFFGGRLLWLENDIYILTKARYACSVIAYRTCGEAKRLRRALKKLEAILFFNGNVTITKPQIPGWSCLEKLSNYRRGYGREKNNAGCYQR